MQTDNTMLAKLETTEFTNLILDSGRVFLHSEEETEYNLTLQTCPAGTHESYAPALAP